MIPRPYKITAKPRKFKYVVVIQQYYGQGWEDVSQYDSNSYGQCLEKHTDGTSLLKHDLKEYRLTGYPTRTIKRKEKI